MGADWQAVWTCLSILLLTFFLDATELAYSNLLFFCRTLRFWLFFLAHFGLSIAVAFAIHRKSAQMPWYELAPMAAFLGVGLFAKTNIEIAGRSLAPIGKMFAGLKAKMLEQAGQAKADELYLARLIQQMTGIALEEIEVAHLAGLMAAGLSAVEAQERQKQAKSASPDLRNYQLVLIGQFIQYNRAYAEDCVKKRGKKKQQDVPASE